MEKNLTLTPKTIEIIIDNKPLVSKDDDTEI